jgi:hypothetical protein
VSLPFKRIFFVLVADPELRDVATLLTRRRAMTETDTSLTVTVWRLQRDTIAEIQAGGFGNLQGSA